MSATPEARLARIAEAHHKHVDEHGGTYGLCNECDQMHPCPTYVWATTERDTLNCWDPNDDDEEVKSAMTDEQLVAMTQQYSQTRNREYVAHEAYKAINEQVKEGRQWAKCPNCGNPYPLDKEGANGTTCSPHCHNEYLDYVMGVAG